MMPIVEELAQRGHQITIISQFQPSKSVDNIQEIVLNELKDSKEFEEINWFDMQTKAIPAQVLDTVRNLQGMIATGYDALMNHEPFRAILRQRNIDLVLYDGLFNDYIPIICDYLKVPCVLHSSSSGFRASKAMGVSMDYASVPFSLNDLGNQMSFFQRVENFVSAEVILQVYRFTVIRMLEEKIARDFPNSRPIEELDKETSLAFLNIHPATSWVRSLPPTVIPIGALHTRPAKLLPLVKM